MDSGVNDLDIILEAIITGIVRARIASGIPKLWSTKSILKVLR